MSAHEQAKENMDLVNKLMAESTGKKAQAVEQGHKARISVDIDYTADSGKTFTGTLVCRRPTPMDYIRIGAAKSNVLRAFGVRPIVDVVNGQRIESMAHLDQSITFLITSICTFDVLLVEAPEWFGNYKEIDDTDLVVHCYDRFDEELASFRRGSQGGPARDREDGTDAQALAPSEDVRRESNE